MFYILFRVIFVYNTSIKISGLTCPNKSHPKEVSLPNDSAELAELMGIIFGDGGINNNWQIKISLNSVSDLKYSLYINDLCSHLFGIKTSSMKRHGENTLVVIINSTTVVNYLISKGAKKGNKIHLGLTVPVWIKENPQFIKYFVRGLVDTDGCLYIHKHNLRGKFYSNIGFCFTSYDRNLIEYVSKIFVEEGIKNSITDNGRRIYLYSAKAVLKYLQLFGSSNPRIYNKLAEWRDHIVV